MNPIFQYVISESAKRQLKKKKKRYSNEIEFEKEIKNATVEFNHIISDSVFILIGTFSASFGLGGFLLPNAFIDGGITGISLIISELSGISLSVFLLGLNLPFMFLAYSTISRQFALKSIIAIVILSISVHFIPFPTVTEDKLLIAVFGGFFLGLGIGLSIRGGAVIDGTEVLAIYISKKVSMTIGDVILVFNVMIFSVAAYVFSVEIALYAMLTYLAASKTVDFVVSGIEEYIGVVIISRRSEEIRLAIIENMGRGCTIYSGKNGYAKRNQALKDTEIVYSIITRLELSKLKTEIDKIDKHAFIIMHTVKDVKGGVVKKRPLH